MKPITFLTIFLFFVCGCSSADGITSIGPDEAGSRALIAQTTHWQWHTGLYRVSADHTSIEAIPIRESSYHFNVNQLVEPPNCSHCLKIAKPQIQGDGTLKVQVILSHPFPNMPKYTGFDVRGLLLFPATRYWEISDYKVFYENDDPVFPDQMPAYFSRAEDGGGELLNADGFTLYFFPELNLGPTDQPIFKYSKGNRAFGPDPDSTINGYKLFTNDPERRMFRVNETISHLYHIAPPQGEFIFGYVVDASWAPPETTPVTDPMTDFPFWANCEDGYVLSVVQTAPFELGTYGMPSPAGPTVTSSSSLIIDDPSIPGYGYVWSFIYCPDIVPDPDSKSCCVAISVGGAHKPSDDVMIHIQTQQIDEGTYAAEPGSYLALFVQEAGWAGFSDYWPTQFGNPHFFDFFYLEVVDNE